MVAGRQPDAVVWPGVLAMAVVGMAFAVAVTLRVQDAAEHPVSEHVGAMVSVVVVAGEDAPIGRRRKNDVPGHCLPWTPTKRPAG